MTLIGCRDVLAKGGLNIPFPFLLVSFFHSPCLEHAHTHTHTHTLLNEAISLPLLTVAGSAVAN